jgi:hypothetical protein
VPAGFAAFAAFAVIGLIRPWPKMTWGRTRVRVSRLGYLGMLTFLAPLTAIAFVELVLDIDPGGKIILTAVGVALAGWVLTLVAAMRDVRRDPENRSRRRLNCV